MSAERDSSPDAPRPSIDYTAPKQYGDPTAFVNELHESKGVGKATVPIDGNGCQIVSTNGGVRYLDVCSHGVLWVRPDGIGTIATESETQALLPEFNTLEVVAKNTLSQRVRTALAALPPDNDIADK